MRIGILTFHKAINYGAYLQAFSLFRKLQESFPTDQVEIIDYQAPKERNRKFYTLLWNVKHYGLKGGLAELKRVSVFRSMQKHFLLSPKSFCTRKLKKLYVYINGRYDVLIIGSDAVFNWNQTKFPSAFIPDYPFTIPVFTYAASVHGLRFYAVPSALLQRCGRAFDRMKYVGVRDACSERFVKLCAPNAKTLHCCDPTLFINKEDISEKGGSVAEKLQKKYGFSLDTKYIVVMAPDSNMVRQIRQRYGNEYKFVSVFVKSSYADLYVSDLDPFEWTVVLKRSSMVITSYFHGTLLSLVQGTPTVVIDYSGYCDEQYEGKLKDLMYTRFHLPELYHENKEAEHFVDDTQFFEKIDEILRGGFDRRIEAAVNEERKSIHSFINLVKGISTDAQE